MVNEEEAQSAVSVRNIVVSVGLSLAVLAGIAYFTFEPGTFWQMVNQMSPGLLFAALLITLARVFFGGWRLQFISRGRLNYRQGTRGQLAWDFFSNVTPSAIGGGPIAAFYIARDRDIPIGEASAFVLFSILLDQFWSVFSIPIVILASFYLEVIPGAVGSFGTWSILALFMGMLIWSALFAYSLLFHPQLLEWLADRIFSLKYLSRFHDRVMEEMRAFTRQAHMIRAEPPSFYFKGFLLTTGVWMGRYLLVVFIVWSVYAEFDKILMLLRTVAMHLSALVLPTPGGSGGLEGLYALFIAPMMPEALVAPTLLTWRVLGYYIFVALGVYLFMHQFQQTVHRQEDSSDEASPSENHEEDASARPASSTAKDMNEESESASSASDDAP